MLAVDVSANFGRGRTCQRPLTDSTSRLLTNPNLTLEVEVTQVELQAGKQSIHRLQILQRVWVCHHYVVWRRPQDVSRFILVTKTWCFHKLTWTLSNQSSSTTHQINVDDEPAASLLQWPLIQSLLYTRASCERLLLYCFTTLLPFKSHL